jgi:hypothetical protein
MFDEATTSHIPSTGAYARRGEEPFLSLWPENLGLKQPQFQPFPPTRRGGVGWQQGLTRRVEVGGGSTGRKHQSISGSPPSMERAKRDGRQLCAAAAGDEHDERLERPKSRRKRRRVDRRTTGLQMG